MSTAAANKLKAAISQFDAWLAKSPERRSLMNGPATAPAVRNAEKKLGCKLPASMTAFYTWRDGAPDDSELFDTLIRETVAEMWSTYNADRPFSIRLMSLAEVVAAGTTDAHLAPDGECQQAPFDFPTEKIKLVPFVWIRDDGDDDARLDAQGGKEEPWDPDWLIAVDDTHERIWLFEVLGDGLEGVYPQADHLGEWLGDLVPRLTKLRLDGETESTRPQSAAAARAATAPAATLIEMLASKRWIELAEGVSARDVAPRLAPILAKKPEKIAVRAAIDFFTEDDAVAEVFADDDDLKIVIREFLD